MTTIDRENTFRHIDAIEYANAWNVASSLTDEEIKKLLRGLHDRIILIVSNGESNPSYLHAAYRAYDNVLAFRDNPSCVIDLVVRLNPCQEEELE